MIRTFRAGRLRVSIHGTRQALGSAAASEIAAELRRVIRERGSAAAVFGAAPSQNEVLEGLAHAPDLDWHKVTAFHLDEYAGATADAPHSFRRFLVEHLFSKAAPGAFHGIEGSAPDPEAECARYAALLRDIPPDVALLGIGENGHLAFIDPPICDFDDPLRVRVVEMDETCRRQQVHDGAFRTLAEVPPRALTMTVPAILAIPKLFIMVPGTTKREAVRAALEGPIATSCPASVLRTHPDGHLFLDRDSAALLPV